MIQHQCMLRVRPWTGTSSHITSLIYTSLTGFLSLVSTVDWRFLLGNNWGRGTGCKTRHNLLNIMGRRYGGWPEWGKTSEDTCWMRSKLIWSYTPWSLQFYGKSSLHIISGAISFIITLLSTHLPFSLSVTSYGYKRNWQLQRLSVRKPKTQFNCRRRIFDALHNEERSTY